MIFWKQLKIQNGPSASDAATISFELANEPVTFDKPISVPMLTATSATIASLTIDNAVTLPADSSFVGSVTLPAGSGITNVLTKNSDEYELNVGTVTATNASITNATITAATITNADITTATIGNASVSTLDVAQLNVTNPVKLPLHSTIGGNRPSAVHPSENSLYIDGHFGDYEDYIHVTNYSLQDIVVLIGLYTDSAHTNPYVNARTGQIVSGTNVVGKGRTASVLNFWDADGDPAKNMYVYVRWRYPNEENNWRELNEGVFRGDDVNTGLYRTFGSPTTDDWFRLDMGYSGDELWFIYSCPFSDTDTRRASFLNMLDTMSADYNYVLFNNTWQTIENAISQARMSTAAIGSGGLIAFRDALQ